MAALFFATGRRSAKLARRAGILVCLTLAFLSARGFAELLGLPLRSWANTRPPCASPARTLVVLGGGAYGENLPSESSLARVVAAVDFLRARPLLWRVVFTGGTTSDAPPEATVLAGMFARLAPDLSPEVLLEEQALNTYQNAAYVAKLLPGEPVVLLTSDFHLLRSTLAFQGQGMSVCPVPAPSRHLRTTGAVNAANLRATLVMVNEYVGLLGYWMRGWFTAAPWSPQPAAEPLQ